MTYIIYKRFSNRWFQWLQDDWQVACKCKDLDAVCDFYNDQRKYPSDPAYEYRIEKEEI